MLSSAALMSCRLHTPRPSDLRFFNVSETARETSAIKRFSNNLRISSLSGRIRSIIEVKIFPGASVAVFAGERFSKQKHVDRLERGKVNMSADDIILMNSFLNFKLKGQAKFNLNRAWLGKAEPRTSVRLSLHICVYITIVI
jgi:hypothetical protein